MKIEPMKMVGMLALCLLAPVLVLGIHQWQINKPHFYGSAGWKTDAIGERATIGSLFLFLNRNPTINIVAVGYDTPEDDGRYLSQVKRGTRPYSEWTYELEYNRLEKTLTKRLFVHYPRPKQPTRIWVWNNVSEDSINQLSAPVRALKTVQQIEAYKGGNLDELKKYGATMHEEKS